MEGIGLDNVLGAEEVEKLFANEPSVEEDSAGEQDTTDENSDNNNQTAEVDFSDLIGNQSESVGSGDNSEGDGEAPDSKNDTGAPQNLFSSIAKALRDEGVFPDLSDDTLDKIKDADAFRKLFDEQVANSLSEREKRIEAALNGGGSNEEVRGYQNDLSILEFLDAKETLDRLEKEDDEGETLRKQMMYQDYINRGFSSERAKKLVQKSLDDGTDLDDAKEAYNSCKEFYKNRVDSYQKTVESMQKAREEEEKKTFNHLKKEIIDTEDFFGGVKVPANLRQKAYDSITKPVVKDDNGNYLTAMQQYQREHPVDFMKNVAMLYSLTDGFKSVENLTKSKIKAGVKKGLASLENVFNNTRRNSDGSLNFANGEPSDEERENWTLAI